MMVALRNALVGNKTTPSSEYWGLCFTATTSAGSHIQFKKSGTPPDIELETSTNGTTWTSFVAGTDEIYLNNIGDKVYFRAGQNGNTKFASSTSSYWHILLTQGPTAASGNVMSLINGIEETSSLAASAFCGLFRSCLYLTEPPDLPATTMSGASSYVNMFYNCYRMTRIPRFPTSIYLAGQPAGSMFYGCTGLTTVDMSGIAYSGRLTTSGLGASFFSGCTGLTYIKPSLISIGSNTFSGCTNLAVVDFRHAVSVISLSNINVFNNTNDTYKIVVPDSLYSSWVTATNWKDTSIVGHIVKASDYVEA